MNGYESNFCSQFPGIQDLRVAWRHMRMWTAHGHSDPSLLHATHIKISGSLASHSPHNSVGRLQLDRRSCYFHQRRLALLHRRSTWNFPFISGFLFRWLLLVVYQVGVLIEEPFCLHALDEQCEHILAAIHDALAMQSSVNERVLAKRKACVDSLFPNGHPSS